MTVESPRDRMTGAPGEPDLVALARTGTVHMVGIAGAGMSAIAEYLLRAGGRVTGCDATPGDAAEALRALGAVITKGHDAAHVDDAAAVVTTAAVRADHPELAAARARGIPLLKRSHALATIVNRGTLAAVAGTHGKTTTTAMLASILEHAGMDPTAFVGGRVPAWGGGLRVGSDRLFVAEADEFDRSFLWLRPDAAIVTSVEADHLDVYGGLDSVIEAFVEFVELLPETGLLAACADDAVARTLAAIRPRGITYGTAEDATLRAVGIRAEGRGSHFELEESGRVIARIELGAPGLHNVRNALGAFAVARELGAGTDAALEALRAFHGVARRFQELGDAGGVTFVDDYAHHPTEVAATLDAARQAYPDRRLVAVFQPHLFTRTRDFAAEFGARLAAADVVVIMDVYPAREQPLPGVTGELVVEAALHAAAREVRYAPGAEALADTLAAVLRPGDVCVGMGAGDVDVALRRVYEQRRQP